MENGKLLRLFRWPKLKHRLCPAPFQSRPTTSPEPRAISTLEALSKMEVLVSSPSAENRQPSTSRPSSGSIATRCIRPSVFDLDAGPVTITLPDAGKRFMSMQVIDEDQYTPEVDYGAGSHTFTKEKIGTRYVLLAVRTLVDPTDPKDVEAVHALQDAIKVDQPGGPGKFEVPNWDQASQKTVREALLSLASTLPDTKRMFGAKDAVDPVRRLIGSVSAWGGNPEKDALYLNVTPVKNDGKVENCLPTPPGWNYLVRLYRPRPEILDGSWTFPAAEPAD